MGPLCPRPRCCCQPDSCYSDPRKAQPTCPVFRGHTAKEESFWHLGKCWAQCRGSGAADISMLWLFPSALTFTLATKEKAPPRISDRPCFSVCVCVCMCAICVCICMFMHISVCVCECSCMLLNVKDTGQLWVSFLKTPYVFHASLSLRPRCLGWLASKTRSHLSISTSCGYKIKSPHPVFYVVLGIKLRS